MTTEGDIAVFPLFLSFSFHVLRCHDENKIEGGRGGPGGVVGRRFTKHASRCNEWKGSGDTRHENEQKMLDAGFDGKRRSCLDGYGS